MNNKYCSPTNQTTVFEVAVLKICINHLFSFSHSTLFTETPMDYGNTMTLLMFKACETRRCINVTIEDDDIAELTEFFSGNLLRTDGLDERITLQPNTTTIEITDNDGTPINSTLGLFICICFRMFYGKMERSPVFLLWAHGTVRGSFTS